MLISERTKKIDCGFPLCTKGPADKFSGISFTHFLRIFWVQDAKETMLKSYHDYNTYIQYFIWKQTPSHSSWLHFVMWLKWIYLGFPPIFDALNEEFSFECMKTQCIFFLSFVDMVQMCISCLLSIHFFSFQNSNETNNWVYRFYLRYFNRFSQQTIECKCSINNTTIGDLLAETKKDSNIVSKTVIEIWNSNTKNF